MEENYPSLISPTVFLVKSILLFIPMTSRNSFNSSLTLLIRFILLSTLVWEGIKILFLIEFSSFSFKVLFRSIDFRVWCVLSLGLFLSKLRVWRILWFLIVYLEKEPLEFLFKKLIFYLGEQLNWDWFVDLIVVFWL